MPEMKLNKQATTVLNHLRTEGSISRLEAFHIHHIAHLPTRVFDLRRAGIDVKMVQKEDATGRKYARYSLA